MTYVVYTLIKITPMNKKLSPLLSTYIKAKNAHDSDMLVSCFTDNAIVYDESEEVKGKEAIKQWADNVFKKYKLTVKVTDIAETNKETILKTLVSGTFPGSPLEIKYHITLSNGKIATLKSD